MHIESGISSSTFTLLLEDQNEIPSSMRDLLDFVLIHTQVEEPVCFNYNMEKLNSTSDLKSGKLEKTTISSFVKLEDLK